MSGTKAFIMRIEKDIPSGYEPQRRMMIVISPIPKAYRHLPFIVIGDVTMSVAMKKEPRRSPPPRTWNSGLTYVEGSMSQHIPATRVTVPMMMTGVCQSMIFLMIR